MTRNTGLPSRWSPTGAETPVDSASLDRCTATGVTSGPIEGSAILLPFADDGSFNSADTTTSDLLYFPAAYSGGALVEVEYGASTIFALFRVDGNSFPGTPWGPFVRVTVSLTAADWSGSVSLIDHGGLGSPTLATTTLDGVSPIPLPETLPLLVVALGLGTMVRRHT